MNGLWAESFAVFTVSLLLYCTSHAEGATSCVVRKTEGNTTYLDTTLCEHGCCVEDELANKCCDKSLVNQGVVLGIVIVVSLVIMAFCIYVRLKIALRSAKRQTRTPQDTEPSPEASTEANPELDPPPSYWTCVSEAPPQYVPSTSSSVITSSDTNSPRFSSPDIAHAAVHTVSEGDDQHPSGAARATSENVQTNVSNPLISGTSVTPGPSMDLSSGIVLQPSSFHISSLSSPSEPGSVQQIPELPGPASNVKEGSVVMFVPGQLSPDACQSMLHTYGGSQVIICKAGENSSTSECFDRLSSNLSDGLSHTPSTESAGLESSTVTPTRVSSPSGFDQSSLSDILNRLASGSVVIFAKTDTNVPRV